MTARKMISAFYVLRCYIRNSYRQEKPVKNMIVKEMEEFKWVKLEEFIREQVLCQLTAEVTVMDKVVVLFKGVVPMNM